MSNPTATLSAPINILLVEDSPSDAGLAKRALYRGDVPKKVHVVESGEDALRFMSGEAPFADSPRPELVLLDLNLPGKNGHEVLAEMKAREDLKEIPVIMMSTSKADNDIRTAYRNMANCYIIKPRETSMYDQTVEAIESFWLRMVMLPSRDQF